PIYLWRGSPFGDRTPEFLAALCTLSQFRRRVLSSRPEPGSVREPTGVQLRTLLSDRTQLEARVLGALHSRREAREEMVKEMGLLETSALHAPGGEPHVVVWTGPGDPWVYVSWGETSPRVSFGTAPGYPHAGHATTLARLLGDDVERAAFEDLERDIERELGCRLGSQSWGRPELVPAWAW